MLWCRHCAGRYDRSIALGRVDRGRSGDPTFLVTRKGSRANMRAEGLEDLPPGKRMTRTGPRYITPREVHALTPKGQVTEVRPDGRSVTRIGRFTEISGAAELSNTEVVELDDPITVRCRSWGQSTTLTLRIIADEVLPPPKGRRPPAAS